MTTLCIVFSTGWAVACAALFFLYQLSESAPRWLAVALIFAALAGVASGAAEDRVCEVAGLGDR